MHGIQRLKLFINYYIIISFKKNNRQILNYTGQSFQGCVSEFPGMCNKSSPKTAQCDVLHRATEFSTEFVRLGCVGVPKMYLRRWKLKSIIYFIYLFLNN